MNFIITFIFGTIIGSFLNVCIYRLPIDISIVKPNSFCPSCKNPIKWYDNIPILSYIFLKGKCRYCKINISIQYPLIEFFTGLITALFFLKFQNNFIWFISSILICYLLIVVSVIDFRTMLISDFFSFSIAFIGIISSLINPSFDGSYYNRLVLSLSGLITGSGFIFALSYIGKVIYKKDAVGEGDIFLLGAIGTFSGFYGIINIIIISSFLGSLYGISLILFKRADRLSYIPFGPFLSLAAIINLYFQFNLFDLFFSL